MSKIKYFIGVLAAAGAMLPCCVQAADAKVEDVFFKQNGEVVHTLSNGELECVVKASDAGNDAVMLNAVYEKNSGKLKAIKYVKASDGTFSSTVNVTDASNTYVTMTVWDGLSSAVAKTQVYSIAAEDPAPEDPWNLKVNNKGGVSFTWGASEDNLKTAGYRIYKNGEMVGDTAQTSFTDDVKWYQDETADYRLTAYDEYGNESEGKTISDVKTDKSDLAAILFSQPNITEKMSLYFATGKDSDDSWYGYNTSAVIDGTACRKIPVDRRAVFKFSNSFKDRIGTEGREAVIRVAYYDNDTDYFRISYVGTSGRYTDLEVKKNGTNQWLTKEFHVSDLAPYWYDAAKKENKVQDESIDFTIWSKAASDKGDINDTETYISEISIVLEGETKLPATEAPTLAPGQTPSPTPTATPEPTPAPTLDPSSINKASIKFLDGQTVNTCSESESDLIHIFWAGKNNDEQIDKDGWYGYNYGAEINGEKCRVLEDNKRLVLIYDNALNQAIGDTARSAVIRVKYLDKGTGTIRASYIGEKNRYTNLSIKKTDSGEWKWAEFPVTDLIKESTVKDVNNGGYQDGKIKDPAAIYPDGPNFSIYARGDGEGNDNPSETEYIAEVEIVLNDSPSHTTAPAETEKPITSAQIKLLAGNDTAESSYESEHMSVYWGKNNGQIGKTGWYAYTEGMTKAGEECRKIDDNKRIVLMYDEALNAVIGAEPRNAVIRVRYYDEGTDKIRVSYVSKAERYQTVTIQKTGSNTWKWAEFNVSDLANVSDKASNDGWHIQDEGTYFSIWSRASGENEENNTPDYISAVELVLTESPSQTTVPSQTTAPSETGTPTATSTPAPTNPAETEKPITSAQIKLLVGNDTAESSYESEHMSVYWGKNNGQVGKTGWYAYTEGMTKAGEECRKIDDNKRIVLMYDEALDAAIGAEPRNAVIRVRYYDEGTDKIRVSYVSKAERYQTVTIQKTGSNTWKWAEFNVSDLANVSDKASNDGWHIQDEGTYFSIWSRASGENEENNTPDYISAVEIVLTDAPAQTTAPAETGTPTTGPTSPAETEAPTTGPTSPAETEAPTTGPTSPAETEAPITSAQIKLLAGNDTAASSYESEHMSVYWSKNDGQVGKTGWYAYTEGMTKDGEECRKIDDNKRIVLMYDEALNAAIGAEPRNAVIRVRYYDEGTDKIRVSYVSKAERYQTVTIQKTGSNTWKWAEFNVSDLANVSDKESNDGWHIQDEGTYFSIWSRASGENEENNTPDYISAVEIVLTDAPAQTTAPAETGTPTTGPTSPAETEAPTTGPTSPAETEAPITSAQIKLLAGNDTAESSYESEHMSVYWSKNDGQVGKTGWYAYTEGMTKDGEECRRIDDNKRIVLMYDEALNAAIGAEPRNAVIRVRYYDEGTDKIRVSYVSKAERYQTVTIQKTGSNTWKWAEFNVSDFANVSDKESNDGWHIQDEGTYFSIWSRASGENEENNTPDYISAVELVLTDTPAQTTEPSETGEPTTDPTPTAPSETEAPITSAQIKLLAGNDTAESSYESEHMSVYWSKNDGQVGKTGWYAYTEGMTKDGEECRRIDDNKRIVLMYDEALNAAIGAEPRNAVIRVRYYDEGTDKIRVSYVSKAERYQTVTIQKTGSNTWKWAEFNVSDFANVSDKESNDGWHIQDEGTYFSIWSRASGENEENNTPDYISAVELVLANSPEPTPTTPSETEAPITSAQIKLLAGNDTADNSYESTHMSVYWGKNDGQIANTGWYAYTEGMTKDGEECRKIGDNKRIVLMYDEALNEAIGAEPKNAVIRVKYYDEGTDKIRVSYIGESARYKTVTIQKENTNTWKWAEISVTDLINKAQDGHETGLQDESTYFSIWSRASGENEENNTPDYIAAVELILTEDQTSKAE